ncbi:MAG: ribosomal protein S18-alanine N-acetyltransferase [Desulfuromonadales bacterium]
MPIIRPMTSSDLDAVLAIEQASFPHSWKREHFEHEIDSPHSFPFVAADETGVLGYVCLMSLFEEAQILDIAVSHDQRGRGVARLLLDYAFGIASGEGAEVLALEVRETNMAAIKLYEGMGFSRCGSRPRYYDGVDDAVLMEKCLKRKSI